MRLVIYSLLVAAACSPGPSVTVDGCSTCKVTDGGRPDAGRVDAGPSTNDAGPGDGGVDGGDAGAGSDGGALDAGLDAGPPLTGEVCPSGSVPFGGVISDLCAEQALGTAVPLTGVQVATLEPYSATFSGDAGIYSICLPPGRPVTLVFTKPTYLISYQAELAITSQLPLANAFGDLYLACSALLQNYALENPLVDPNEAFVLSEIVSATGAPPCGGTDAGYSGWRFEATPTDGGTGFGTPWPTAYIDSSGNLQSVPTTFGTGRALMYDIDPSVGFVAVDASNSALGGDCASLDFVGGLTGRVYVAAGAFSFFPWAVP